MKCKNCGFEFDEGIFCPECGTKYDVEEAKRQADELKAKEKLHRQEKIKERELEVEKAKAEQERLATERVKKEAELERIKAENLRAENAAKEKAEAEDRKRLDEQRRTFNNVLYDSVEEMLKEKEKYEEEAKINKEIKRADIMAILSLILGIATYPLSLTVILGIIANITSIVLGFLAIRKTNKKVICVLGIIFGLSIWVLGIGLEVYFTVVHG